MAACRYAAGSLPWSLSVSSTGVERRGDLGATSETLSRSGSSARRPGANRALGGVVVERDPRVLDEAREALPVSQGGRGRLANGERRQRRLLPEPRLELREHCRRLGSAQLSEAREVALGLAVQLIERTDPRERLLGLRMIGLGLLETTKGMRPAGRQRAPAAGSRAGGGSGQRVADDRPGVLAHQVDEGRRALVVADPVCRAWPLPGCVALRAGLVVWPSCGPYQVAWPCVLSAWPLRGPLPGCGVALWRGPFVALYQVAWPCVLGS